MSPTARIYVIFRLRGGSNIFRGDGGSEFPYTQLIYTCVVNSIHTCILITQ